MLTSGGSAKDIDAVAYEVKSGSTPSKDTGEVAYSEDGD